jgi:DNA-binding MarR family transcriptional regulator
VKKIVKIHPRLEPYFGYCLYKSAHRIRSNMDEKLKVYGLVAPQLGILTIMYKSDPLSQVDLGQYMHIDKASMVKLLDGLEKKKLITRTPDKKDRRVKYLNITTKGRQLREKLEKLRLKVEEDFLSKLTASERRTIRKLMLKLLVSQGPTWTCS